MEKSLESFIDFCDEYQIAEEASTKDKDYNNEFADMMKSKGIKPGKKTYQRVKSDDEDYVSYSTYDESYSGTKGDYDNGLMKDDISENKKMLAIMKQVTSELVKKYPGLKVSHDNYRGHATISFYMPKDNPYLSKVCNSIVKEMKSIIKSQEYITKYGKAVCDTAISDIKIDVNDSSAIIYPPEHAVYKKINNYDKFNSFYGGIHNKIKSFIKSNYNNITLQFDMQGLCEFMISMK